MAACDFCDGKSHYLSNDPALGPCVCCTPENMQKRDRTIEALTALPAEPEKKIPDGAHDIYAPRTVFARLGLLEAELGRLRVDMSRQRNARTEGRGNVASALADYFVSLGLPAVPVTLDPGPLADLYALIGPAEDVLAEDEDDA